MGKQRLAPTNRANFAFGIDSLFPPLHSPFAVQLELMDLMRRMTCRLLRAGGGREESLAGSPVRQPTLPPSLQLSLSNLPFKKKDGSKSQVRRKGKKRAVGGFARRGCRGCRRCRRCRRCRCRRHNGFRNCVADLEHPPRTVASKWRENALGQSTTTTYYLFGQHPIALG